MNSVEGPAKQVITVYTVPGCLDCAAVKNLLRDAGVPFREVDISEIPRARDALEMLSGMSSAPQVFLGTTFLGQVSQIRHLIQTGEIQRMIAPATEER